MSVTFPVAQTFESAGSRVSKPAGTVTVGFGSARSADLEIGDTAGLETCPTQRIVNAASIIE